MKLKNVITKREGLNNKQLQWVQTTATTSLKIIGHFYV